MGLISEELARKVRYLGWAITAFWGADSICPSCGSESAQLVRRKYVVTSLYDCPNCHIRFRVPKESAKRAEKLYKKEKYRQEFTTTLPNDEQLAELLRTQFRGLEKDFTAYIAVIKSLLPNGGRVLDFGCSWGYGSWQIRQAGFDVFSFEVGEDRARYAKEKLGCKMVENFRALDGTINCLFSSHVIEHLPNPDILLSEVPKLLVPGGYFVCFCPNGNPDRRDKFYHQNWNKVHPLMITPEFLRWAFKRHGLTCCEMKAGEDMLGGELLAVARKDF
jgi:2-polyprenyl-3-methyl-5-hydroxy-6-metoxy-1,4-benzoquinol methylase